MMTIPPDGPGAPVGDRRSRELSTLIRAGELLDPVLSQERLVALALELSLGGVHADAALLVLQDERGGATTHAQRRGEDRHHTLSGIRSRLAEATLRTGQTGERREQDTPGARAAAALLGQPASVRLAAPLLRSDRTFGVLEVAYREDPGKRLDEEQRALTSVADHLAVALDAARLVREERRRSSELAHLVDIGTRIAGHFDLDELLEVIVQAIQELIPANAVGLFLIDRESGVIQRERVVGYELSRVDDLHLKIGRGILGWVAREGKAINVADVREDDRYVAARHETRSELAAPLQVEGEVIGVFNLEADRVGAFDERDQALLVSFSNQAAISITHARLLAEATEKRRLEEQLNVARRIQESLLPHRSPDVPGHVLAGQNVASFSVGGDYFDFLPLSNGRWAILVADVSGNGIPAGLIMAGFRAEIRAELRRDDDPRRVLARVNNVLAAELDPHRFVTAFLGVYAPASGTLVYASAGHEPALLLRHGGEVERLSEGGLLLGVFPDANYASAMVNVGPGDVLLLYTDGLSDAGDPWGDRLEEAGILRLFADLRAAGRPLERIPAELLARAVRDAADPSDEADDRTLVLLARDVRAPKAAGNDQETTGSTASGPGSADAG
jgi:sigma-B regulation protein RsbU (phosphoserine phosphatase)